MNKDSKDTTTKININDPRVIKLGRQLKEKLNFNGTVLEFYTLFEQHYNCKFHTHDDWCISGYFEFTGKYGTWVLLQEGLDDE